MFFHFFISKLLLTAILSLWRTRYLSRYRRDFFSCFILFPKCPINAVLVLSFKWHFLSSSYGRITAPRSEQYISLAECVWERDFPTGVQFRPISLQMKQSCIHVSLQALWSPDESLQRRSIADSVFARASDRINGGRLQLLLAGCWPA